MNVHFFASDDPYKKHRALHLRNIGTDFSGRYSCRVSSIYDDEFRSAEMIIYGEQGKCTKLATAAENHVIREYNDPQSHTARVRNMI